MQIIRNRAFARAGLLGNPSDGYNGKTISVIIKNYWADVVLYEWDSVDIMLADNDRARFNSIQDLARDVKLHGYYGGIRLIKATIKRFMDYCISQNLGLHERNFTIRYETNIPRQVGLGGSSAIIVATLRCLMDFYGISIAKEAQPTLVLSVEKEELGIAAGLQDRVIQVYEGVVYMDFDRQCQHEVNGVICYAYESLEPELLPPLYLAYHDALSEPTEVFHNDIRGRFNRGEEIVVNAMKHFATLAYEGKEALFSRDISRLKALINENFDTRKSIYNLPPWQVQMVDIARACGACAKFAGSGGAIIGIYDDDTMFSSLKNDLSQINTKVIKLDFL